MLLLTRRRGGATDLIDRDSGIVLATVTVLGVTPDGAVRLGFEAQPHIHILRDDAIRRDHDGEEDNRGNR